MGQVNSIKRLTRGQIDAALMKIGQDAGLDTVEGILAFLRGDLIVIAQPRNWHEEEDVISFEVTSNGMTMEEWIDAFDVCNFNLTTHAVQLLQGLDFQPTNGVKTEVVVLKGKHFEDSDRTTKNVVLKAEVRNLQKLSIETIFLIRIKFSNKELQRMGLTAIIGMHDPVKDTDGHELVFGACRCTQNRHLAAYFGSDDVTWPRTSGHAFSKSSST